MIEEKIYDCIIIGGGPGGLQAAIYLCRYNRKVLLLDRGGGRTSHSKHIENFLTQPAITGKEIIEKGLSQVMHFGAEYHKAVVSKVIKNPNSLFEVSTKDGRTFFSLFIIVSTGVMDNLPVVVALVTFIPVITAMGGNIGRQSSSIMIRGFAIGRVDFTNLRRFLFKEIRIGLLMGVACGVVAGSAAMLWHKDPLLGPIVALAMVTAITTAASMGTLVPAFFKKIKIDPAIAAGPFVTTANDIVGILIYLGIATVFLKFLAIRH